MSAFLSLLAAYYACDTTAMTRVMSVEEARDCSAIYRQVKLSFVAGDEARMLDGYLAFKDWEAANAEVVASLR